MNTELNLEPDKPAWTAEQRQERQTAMLASIFETAARVTALTGARRIRLSRARGWKLPQNAVSVARPTQWGNPFVVGLEGSRADCVALHALLLNGLVCLSCKVSLEAQRTARDHAGAYLPSLAGRDLACWCSLDGPCHADTLLIAANRAALAQAEGRDRG